MALAIADRVRETTTTSGTGTINLAGAVDGFRTFVAGIGNGNTCHYLLEDGNAWEVGLGTVTDASPDTLSRDTVIASSNAGSQINLSGGTTRVSCVLPGSRAHALDALGVLPGVPLNIALSPSVAGNALTMALKNWAGNNHSAADPGLVPFRSATASSGDQDIVAITSALSLTISSGSTLGHASTFAARIYWYLINNAGAAELAAACKYFGHSGIVSTTAEGGAGAADSATVMYSTTARSNVPFICIGYTEDTQTVAGTWAAAPTLTVNAPFKRPMAAFSVHRNNVSQTIGTGAITKVVFTTEAYDVTGEYDTSNTNFRPKEPMIVSSKAQLSLADGAYYNGIVVGIDGALAFQKYRVSGGGGAEVIDHACNLRLLPTNYVDINVYQSSGSDKALNGSPSVTGWQVAQVDAIYE